MLQRNFGFKTKLDIVWPSDFSPSYHVWAAELGTTRVFTHACIWQVEHALSPPCPNMGSMPGTTSSYHDVIIWGPPFCISCSRNVQCSMNVEDCVISKICNGNSIMVNTVMLENYKVNCWDIWLLCNLIIICIGNSITFNTVMLENYKVNCWDIWLLCNLIIICIGNSITVNTVMLENYKVNCWDIWLLCNIDGTGPLCLARPTL